jgi:hypothetical protein
LYIRAACNQERLMMARVRYSRIFGIQIYEMFPPNITKYILVLVVSNAQNWKKSLTY